MAYPPTIPASGRQNTTPQVDNHIADHNETSAAFTDIVNELGSTPSGAFASLSARLDNIEDSFDEIGSIKLFSGPVGPQKVGTWRLANGDAISRTTYVDLFNLVSTTFGNGNGSTTFNIPNLSDKVPRGTGGSTALGATGGSSDAVTIDHDHTMPAHDHSVSGTVSIDHDHGPFTTAAGGAHSHTAELAHYAVAGRTLDGGGGTSVALGQETGGVWTGTGIRQSSAGAGHQHSIDIPNYNVSNRALEDGLAASKDPGDTNNRGVSGTEKNWPPYVGVGYWIRVS